MAADGLVGLNVLGHFCYPSGLQASARAIVESLRRVGVRTASRDVPTEIRTHVPGHGDYLGLEVHDVSLLHVQPEPFFETAYVRAGLAERTGVYRVGLWYWELETAPPEWARIGASLDEMWAPTRFVARALESVMSVPVVPLMPGVELGRFTPRPRAHFGLLDDRVVFLFMFDMASIMERKNPRALLEAFARALRRGARPRCAGTAGRRGTALARRRRPADRVPPRGDPGHPGSADGGVPRERLGLMSWALDGREVHVTQVSPTTYARTSVIGGGEKYVVYVDHALKRAAGAMRLTTSVLSFGAEPGTAYSDRAVEYEIIAGRPWDAASIQAEELVACLRRADVVYVPQCLTSV